jgi:spore coat protein U-like protein
LWRIVRRQNRDCAIAAVLFLVYADQAWAATATSTMAVRLTVTSSCVINSAATLNFGSHGVLVSNVDSTSALRVQCTSGTPYNIGLNAGLGSGATVAVRKMTNGASTINYSLYTTAARTTVWGNTVGTNTVAGTGNGAAQSHTVYGRVPAQTTPAAAVYTDTITVTVTY